MLASANRAEVAYRPTNKATGRTLVELIDGNVPLFGFRALVGESIKYVAIMGGQWVGNGLFGRRNSNGAG